MAAVDAATSQKIGAAITAKGGRFLEAPVSGSKKPAIGARQPTDESARTSPHFTPPSAPQPALRRCGPHSTPQA